VLAGVPSLAGLGLRLTPTRRSRAGLSCYALRGWWIAFHS